MNIFVLSTNPEECASFHNDKHVVKMIVEYAQLLSSVHRVYGYDVGYKLTHKNHPCAIWVRESQGNYEWLLQLLTALNDEWKFRYDHDYDHKSFSVVKELQFPSFIPNIGITPFVLAMPDSYKSACPVASYRTYYLNGKRNLLSFKKRGEPHWLQEPTNAKIYS